MEAALAHLQTARPTPLSPVFSSQKSCCSPKPGSVPGKANHVNDTQGTAGAREGPQAGPPRISLCPAQEGACSGCTWGRTGSPEAQPTGISQVYLWRSCILVFDFNPPSILASARPEEC